ncbi:MAG: ankyrin repeat domain-containing protein [Burkholderiales bacterium]|nr:ankyrin repeat domain-containing protein [Burkholderiales bacterium]
MNLNPASFSPKNPRTFTNSQSLQPSPNTNYLSSMSAHARTITTSNRVTVDSSNTKTLSTMTPWSTDIEIQNIQSLVHGKYENDQFEVKSRPLNIDKLAIIVLSFINGENPLNYIIIGINDNQKDPINSNDIISIQYPIKTRTQENNTEVKESTCADAIAYINKLKTYIEKNTVPQIKFSDYVELKNGNDKMPDIIILEIKPHKTGLIQYKVDKKFYGRIPPTKGRSDYGSDPLDGETIVKRLRVPILKTYYDEVKEIAPKYFSAKPAVPELAVLFDYIFLGRMEEFKILLQQIPTLTQMSDSVGNNALLVAAFLGKIDFIIYLLDECKMSPYITNNLGESALLMAAYSGSLEIVKLLVEKDKQLVYRQYDAQGFNVAITACHYGNLEIVKYLHAKYPTLLKNSNGILAHAVDGMMKYDVYYRVYYNKLLEMGLATPETESSIMSMREKCIKSVKEVIEFLISNSIECSGEEWEESKMMMEKNEARLLNSITK